MQGHVCMLSHFSRVQLFSTPWTLARQAPLPMEFSRRGYWSGLPYPPSRDLPDTEIEPGSPALSADYHCTTLPSEPLQKLANRGDTSSMPCLERCHMPQSNSAHATQLLGLHTTTTEVQAPKVNALQAGKPLQWEIHALQLESCPPLQQLETAQAWQQKPNTTNT